MGQNGAIADPLPPNGACSYVPHAALLSRLVHNMKLWQQCHFYDPYFWIRADWAKLWGSSGCRYHYWSPAGAFTHKHTHARLYERAHTHIHFSFRLAHSHRLWASGFMECEQQFFFMCGLGKQYLEPADRYAIYYPVCWNTSHPPCLPVTRLERSKTGQWTRYWCIKYQRMHFFFKKKKRNRNACDHCPVVNAAMCYLIFLLPEVAVSVKIII